MDSIYHNTVEQFSRIGDLAYSWRTAGSDELIGITNGSGSKMFLYDDNTALMYHKQETNDEWLSIEFGEDDLTVTIDAEWMGDERYDNTIRFDDVSEGWSYVHSLTQLGDFIVFKDLLV